ncbi:hypothetical protein Sango_0373300 [Sesamum angolense]|uniref:DUF4371 domain-containing protein n=1 Tax=Sesamum angolense TaxID=2727404 RepID=A0AAE1XAM6_9LAMI|nr:hypothetical protein Sango_0373300 [Sesamum angolense]
MAIDAFKEYVGGVGSAHSYARRQVQDFMNQRQGVSHVFSSHDRNTEEAYRTRITTVLHVVRLLLMQGLAFRGHDESVTSKNSEIGDSYFSLLVVESRDKSIKEQMAVIVRFVNKKGQVIERFLGVESVSDTSASSLKVALEEVEMFCSEKSILVSRMEDTIPIRGRSSNEGQREIFADIDDEVILQYFQNMQTRRFQLAPRSRSNSDRN